MKNVELYHKTVNVLLDAYNDGELRHYDCEHCAVGEICKEASLKTSISNDQWKYLFTTDKYTQTQTPCNSINPGNECVDKAIKLINETGYTQSELEKVEWAFESSIFVDYNKLSKTKEGQYIGLCAVLDVLKEIHQVKEEVHQDSTKRLEQVYETVTA